MMRDKCLNVCFVCFVVQLPVMAKGIGKNQFKRHFELFIDIIFYSLVSKTPCIIAY